MLNSESVNLFLNLPWTFSSVLNSAFVQSHGYILFKGWDYFVAQKKYTGLIIHWILVDKDEMRWKKKQSYFLPPAKKNIVSFVRVNFLFFNTWKIPSIYFFKKIKAILVPAHLKPVRSVRTLHFVQSSSLLVLYCDFNLPTTNFSVLNYFKVFWVSCFECFFIYF